MENLKMKINADYKKAFKERDVISKPILSVIIGEIQTLEKNTGVVDLSDDEVTKILKKSLKSIKETISFISSSEDSDKLAQATAEQMIIESYLPKEMGVDEIKSKVMELKLSGVTNIGQIMKVFSTLPVDRKLVSEIIKEVL